jgi:hypothetical protein
LRCGKTTAKQTHTEWVREALANPNKDNALIDGADATGNDILTGERFGAYTQIAGKVVKVSDRGRDVNSVGSSDELIRQLMRNQKSLRRDEEAIFTSHNTTVIGDSSTASITAGVGGWIGVKVDNVVSNTTSRGAGGADPTTNGSGGEGGTPIVAPVAGTTRALSETDVREVLREAYMNGGNITMAISTPAVIEKFSSYLFTSSARVATMQTDINQSNRTAASSGNGNAGGGVVAQGSVNIYVSDFQTIELVPDRFMPQADTDNDSLFLIDPTTWEAAFLSGYRTRDLARVGTATNRQITFDCALVSRNPEANGIVADLNATLDMTV